MDGPRQPSTYFFLLTQLLSLGLLWFLFTGTLSWSEAAVGLGAVLLALIAAMRTRAMQLAYFHPHARWLAQAISLPKQVLVDSFSVIRALWRRAAFGEDTRGEFSVAPFPGMEDDPEQTARKALVVMYTSLPPNSYILGIDAEKDLVLYHELVPQGKPPDPVARLGAE